ncbi:MAG: amidophosphoribosyltransferase [Thermoflavifilum sp.]|nr:amidophosphoribosyltransferase [Thermoflavifilum sp.]MCL6514803.1 amidophosphoribosyltransferase [Alicyclobacillus sp.]
MCGVFGIVGVPKAAEITYYALVALQHRGQEAAGIAAADGERIRAHRGLGLVTDVLAKETLQQLAGDLAMGHVRYSTAGSNTVQNAQPIVVGTHRGQVALAHNGNLVNAPRLRIALEKAGSLFQSSSDTEVVLHLLARAGEMPFADAVVQAVRQVRGGFALVLLREDRLVALRDPHGLRPLALGQLGDAWCVASESCAFEAIGARFVRDLAPGELVEITRDGLTSRRWAEPQPRLCVFEHIYFARPDSDIDGWNVHAVRKRMGRLLAKYHPAPGDIVIGVPDSSISAASGYAEQSGIPYEMGLIKNKYIARTFIQPSQEMREAGVRMKLNAVRSVVSGRRVILVDDSIVRGTTIRRIVEMLREAGATEVHVRISSPPYRHPCHYGIDTAEKQLLAAHRSVVQMCTDIGADSLAFLSVAEMMEAFGFDETSAYPFCNACFSGDYPTEVEAFDKFDLERPAREGVTA